MLASQRSGIRQSLAANKCAVVVWTDPNGPLATLTIGGIGASSGGKQKEFWTLYCSAGSGYAQPKSDCRLLPFVRTAQVCQAYDGIGAGWFTICNLLNESGRRFHPVWHAVRSLHHRARPQLRFARRCDIERSTVSGDRSRELPSDQRVE